MNRSTVLVVCALFVASIARGEEAATLEIVVTPTKAVFEPGEVISVACTITNRSAEDIELIFDEPLIKLWVSGTININTSGWKTDNAKTVKVQVGAAYLTTVQVRQNVEIPNLVEGAYKLHISFGTTGATSRYHVATTEIVIKGASVGYTSRDVVKSAQDYLRSHPRPIGARQDLEIREITNYPRGSSWMADGITVRRENLDAMELPIP
jgi:hypothetical protein